MSKSILIVDDDSVNIYIIGHILSPLYQVAATNTVDNAFTILKRESNDIDLILLDIIMPVKNGYDMIYELKKDKELSNIPVIFVTGKDDASDEYIGLTRGAVGYIVKPIIPSKLLAIVAEHIDDKVVVVEPEKQNIFKKIFSKIFD